MQIQRFIIVAFKKWQYKVDEKKAIDNPVYNFLVLTVFIIKS